MMQAINLFLTENNQWLTNVDLYHRLKKMKADECDVLYIHSSLSFGMPNPALKRSELLGCIYETLLSLEVPTLCMPTFTFSFCNGKAYDPATSGSRMGALNEFFRKQDGVIRSVDPLMSVALYGGDRELVTDIGKASIGKDSTFDQLHRREKVKFLFLGTRIGDCFTYMHYLEWLYQVDYRYERLFKGEVVLQEQPVEEEYALFVRYRGVVPNQGSYTYEQLMYDQGAAFICPFGNSTLSLVEEKAASIWYKKCLEQNPHYFVDLENGRLIRDEAFILEKEMVAL